jgi:hypothetical protein
MLENVGDVITPERGAAPMAEVDAAVPQPTTDAGAPEHLDSAAQDSPSYLVPFDGPLSIADGCPPPTVVVQPSPWESCTYPVPATAVPDLVAVFYTAGDQQQYEIAHNGYTICEFGWHYLADNTQIEICGTTCDLLRSDRGAQLTFLFGCYRHGGLA